MRLLGLLLVFAVTAAVFVACGDDDPSEDPAKQPEAGARATYDADGRWIAATKPAAKVRPNLIVLIVDTLRHDCLAGPDGLMPELAALAQDGVTFQNASAPSPWTVPSIASLLTGLLPSAHGCDAPLQRPRLVPAITTFAEVLRESYGYRTAAYTSGPWLADTTGVLQGFDSGANSYALQGTEKILGSFARRHAREKAEKTEKPFFLVVHTYEAHDPYGKDSHVWPARPLQPGRQSKLDVASVTEDWQFARHFLRDGGERVDLLQAYGPSIVQRVLRYVHGGYRDQPRPELAEELRADYEGGVRWVDGLIKSTVDQLRAWGMLENTVLVITSDHGEAFGEHHILAHGRQLYDELVRVPLVILGPGPFRGGREVAGSVGLIDVLPTFLDVAGCAPIQGVHGTSMLPLLAGASDGRPVFSEEILNRDNTGEDVKVLLTGVRSDRWKYIITFDQLKGTVLEEAYDLVKDPGETRDLCRGTGRLDGLTFDAAFCQAVEMARDRIWGAADSSNRLYASPYSGGRAQVTSKRPKACAPGG